MPKRYARRPNPRTRPAPKYSRYKYRQKVPSYLMPEMPQVIMNDGKLFQVLKSSGRLQELGNPQPPSKGANEEASPGPE